MFKIYKLVKDNKVYYVGRTKRSLSIRKSIGLYKRPDVDYIYKTSDIILIEETHDKNRESYWINYYIENGDPIMNIYKNNYDESSSKRKYYIINRDKILKQREEKRNTIEYKEYILEYSKKYRTENRDHINNQNMEIYYKNKLNKNVSNIK